MLAHPVRLTRVAILVFRAGTLTLAAACPSACASAPTTTTDGTGSGGSDHGFPDMDTVPTACASVAPTACTAGQYFLTSATACETLCSGEVFLLCESSTYGRYDCINPGAAWSAAPGSAVTAADAGARDAATGDAR